MVEVGNAIVQWIGSVGFPIVMCIILVYYMKQMEQTHQNELEQLRSTIEQNTIALTKLYEKVEAK